MKFKKIFIVLLMVVLVGCNLKQNTFKVQVGTSDVSEEVYQAILESYIADVTSEIYQQYQIDVDASFWEKDINGSTPLEMLKTKVHDYLKMVEANYQVGNKLGYQSEGLESLVERMNEENELRKAKIENGEVVYGLKEYTLLLYLNYDIELIEEACVEKMEITTQEAKDYYDLNHEMFMEVDQKSYDVIEIYYGINEDLSKNYGKIKADLSMIQEQLKQGSKMNELVGTYQDYYVQLDTNTLDLDFDGDILDLAYDFKEGQISDIIDMNQCLYLIQCIDVKEGKLKDFVDVDQDIIHSLKVQSYQQQVQEVYDSLEVTYEMDLNNWILNCLNR